MGGPMLRVGGSQDFLPPALAGISSGASRLSARYGLRASRLATQSLALAHAEMLTSCPQAVC
jgi:hypothetical protein